MKEKNINLNNSYSLLSFIPIIFIKPVGNISHPSHDRRHSWNKKYRTWTHVSTMSPVLKFTQNSNKLPKDQIWTLWYDSILIKLYIHKYIIWKTFSSNLNAICIGFWTGKQKSTLKQLLDYIFWYFKFKQISASSSILHCF